jgi:hypothetical protein
MPHLDIGNYGSILQSFAINTKIKKYSVEVNIINLLYNNHISYVVRGLHDPFRIVANVIGLFYFKYNFSKITKYLPLTSQAYRKENDFANFSCDADIYCTGSDQIWNMDYASHLCGPRFLSFVSKDKRKFAYASSFGKDWLEDSIVDKTKEWIHQFERISVREESGVNILEEQYGYHNAIQLVDPTLAMPPEFWRQYAPAPRIKGKYILIYNLTKNKQFNEYAKALSKKTGLPLYRLCLTIPQIRFCGKSILIPPIFEFITLIDNAEYVLTDSFHGTAFAMNLNTEVICVNHRENPGRISSLLRLLGQEHRAIKDFNDFDVLNRPTDFDHVNKVLDAERKRVDDFLTEIFSPKE